MLALSITKEGIEDCRRRAADDIVNDEPSRVLRRGDWQMAPKHSIRPGELVQVRDGEEIPADLVLLTSSGRDGKAMVDASSLAGQEGLQVLAAPKLTRHLGREGADLARLKAAAVMSPPTRDLDVVGGALHVWSDDAQLPASLAPRAGAPAGAAAAVPVGGGWTAHRAGASAEGAAVTVGGTVIPLGRLGEAGQAVDALGKHRLLVRGGVLRGTGWAVGAAAYTGRRTKLVLCSEQARLKRSRVDAEVDQAVWLIFAFLFLVISASVAFHSNWQRQNAGAGTYLTFLGALRGAADVSRAFVTHLLLFNSFVPISLYVTLEVVRWCQARRIEGDEAMRGEDGRRPRALTSNLNEDLGRVDFAFLDKTGTLTAQTMDCRALVIDGVIFGTSAPDEPNAHGAAEASRAAAAESTGDGSPAKDGSKQHEHAWTASVVTPPSSTAVSPAGAAHVIPSGRAPSPGELAAELRRAVILCKSGSGSDSRRSLPPAAGDDRTADGDEPPAPPGPAAPGRVEAVPGTTFCDPRLVRLLRAAVSADRAAEASPSAAADCAPQDTAAQALLFLYAVVICHSITVAPPPGADGGTAPDGPRPPELPTPPVEAYRAASSDELAIVLAARAMGFAVVGRSGSDLVLEVFGRRETWTVESTHPFTSSRRHMSVVVRSPASRFFVFSKGADSAMLPRLFNSDDARRPTRGGARGHPSAERAMAANDSFLSDHSVGGLADMMVSELGGSMTDLGDDAAVGSRSQEYAGPLAPSTMLAPGSAGGAGSPVPVSYGSQAPGMRPYTSEGPRAAAPPVSTVSDPLPGTGIRSTSAGALVTFEQRLSELWGRGLRTMVVAARELRTEDVEALRSTLGAAMDASGRVRGRLFDAAASLVERDLAPLGATGIQHDLQPGVPAAVDKLRQAGCQVWMVTGDREEPSVSVAQASGLMRPGSIVVALNGQSRAECKHQLATARAELRSRRQWFPRLVNERLAVVINGNALSKILAPSPAARRREHERIARDRRAARAGASSGILSPSSQDILDAGSDSDSDSGGDSSGGSASSRRGMRAAGGAGCCCRRSGRRLGRRDSSARNRSAAFESPPVSSAAAPNERARTEDSKASAARLDDDDADDDDEAGLDDPACLGACFLGSGGCLFCCCSAVRTGLPEAAPAPAGLEAVGSVTQSAYPGAPARPGFRGSMPAGSEGPGSYGRPAVPMPPSSGCARCVCCSRVWTCCGGLSYAHGSLMASSGVEPGTFAWAALHPASWLPTWLSSAFGVSDAALEWEPLPRERRLLELVRQCKTVIACSMTPGQKAQLVRTVKTMVRPAPVTLAVGDGANDVAMIREAHVGIGVRAMHGDHAERAADFSLPSLAQLPRLLLDHGRQNNLRTGLTILYSFFKNAALVFSLVIFSNFSGYSGTTLYESYLGAGWNVGWTFFPILAVGILDHDVSPEAAMRYPFLYRQGLRGGFSFRALASWTLQGIAYGGAVTGGFYLAGGPLSSGGRLPGLWGSGAVMNLCMVLAVSGRLLVHMHSWSLSTVGSVLLSLGLWVGFVFAYSAIYPATGIAATRDFAGTALIILSEPWTWLTVIIVAAPPVLVDMLAKAVHRESFASTAAIVQEWDRGMAVGLSERASADVTKEHSDAVVARQRTKALRGAGGRFLTLQESPWALSEQDEHELDLVARGSERIKGDAMSKSGADRNRKRAGHTVIGRLRGAGGGSQALSVTGGALLGLDEHLRQVSVLERLTARVNRKQEALWAAIAKRAGRAGRRGSDLGSSHVAVKRTSVVPATPERQHGTSGDGDAKRTAAQARGGSPRSSTGSAAGTDVLGVPAFVARQQIGLRQQSQIGRASMDIQDGGGRPRESSAADGGAPVARRPRRGSVAVAPVWVTGTENDVLVRAFRFGSPLLRQKLKEAKQASAGVGEGLSIALEDGSKPRLTRFTRQFSDDPELERAYHSTFFLGKSLPITRVSLLIAAVLGGAFVVFEYFASLGGNSGFARLSPDDALLRLLFRLLLVVGAFVAAACTALKCFRRRHDTIMFVILLVTGVAKTLLVAEAGTFGQALYLICVLLILRLSVASAVLLALLDLAVFAAAVAANFVGGGAATLINYIPYAGFVLAFSINGAVSIDEAMRMDFLQQARLAAERKSFDDILKSSMPPHVTKKLKRSSEGGFKGMYYEKEEEMSVIFIDIADFEKVTSTHTPQMMVTLLDRLWRLFDALVEKHLVTKMETVGKTYMACAGLQRSRPDHAAALVMLGLDILHTLRSFRDAEGRIISVKIGIHSGPVVSGVAGLKKQQFSLFGDTVNTSARMQGSGTVNRVHVSPDTHRLVDGLFETESQLTPVKSKGVMTTYHIVGTVKTKEAVARRRMSALGMAPMPTRGSSSEPRHSAGIVSPSMTGGASTVAGAGSAASPGPSPGGHGRGKVVPMGVRRLRVSASDAAAALDSPVHSPAQARSPSLSARGDETPPGGATAAAASQLSRSTRHGHSSRSRRVKEARINSCMYVFTDPAKELKYQARRRKGQLRSLRVSSLVLAAFAVFRVLWDEAASERSRIIRVACAGLMALLAALTTVKAFRLLDPGVRHTIVAIALAGAAAMLMTSQADQAGMVLDVLFVTSLTAASGAVHHLGALIANVSMVAIGISLAATHALDFAGDRDLTATTAFFCGVGLVAGWLSSGSRAYYKRRRFDLEGLTRSETARAHGILYNMLPAALVNQIKEGKQGVSDTFRNVTLLFCDIRGFTKMASSVTPEQVVNVLNDLFCKLDAITDKYEVFKVQTIGDAYVIVAGMPFLDKRVSSASHASAQAGKSAVLTARGSAGRLPVRLPSKTSLLSGNASFVSMASTPNGLLSASFESEDSADGGLESILTGRVRQDVASLNRAADGSLLVTGAADGHRPHLHGPPLSARAGSQSGMVEGPSFGGVTFTPRDASSRMHMEDLDRTASDTNRTASDAKAVAGDMTEVEETFAWTEEDVEVMHGARAAGVADPEYQAQHPKRRHTARAMVDVAMEMTEVMKGIRHPGTGEPLVMRIGLHTGDIVGGVIGSKTLRYDIWGTDVLVANKMESEGIPGGLVVSVDTRLALLGEEGLEFRPHQTVTAKGRGEVPTFQVIKTEIREGVQVRIGDVEIEGDGHGGEFAALQREAALLAAAQGAGAPKSPGRVASRPPSAPTPRSDQ